MAATTDTKSLDIGAMFEQAVKMYEEATQAGLHAQEEAVKWYTEALADAGGPHEWQQRVETVLAEALPTVKSNLEEAIDVMNRNAEEGMALLKKAFESAAPGSMDQVHAKTRDLWEHSLGVMRSNAQTMLQMNSRMLDAWGKLAHSDGPAEQAG